MATINVEGTDGADTLLSADDEFSFRFMFGFGGGDRLFGRRGQDVILGGGGDDVLDGGLDQREGSDERTYTARLFANELYGGSGRDVGIIDGREDFFSGDTGHRRFVDVAVIHSAHQTGNPTLVVGFDVKGQGTSGKVQDRFVFADSDSFEVTSFQTRGVRADPDGTGVVLRLISFLLEGTEGEMVEFRCKWSGGLPRIEADDASPEAIEAAIGALADQWSL